MFQISERFVVHKLCVALTCYNYQNTALIDFLNMAVQKLKNNPAASY